MNKNCFSCEQCEHFIEFFPGVMGICKFGLTTHLQGRKECDKFKEKRAYGILPSDSSEKPGVHLRSATDNVNHPSHYETGKFECIDVMLETQGKEAVQSFCVCNAFKYIYRHNNKNGLEDIKKAIWYLNKFVELEESNND